MKVMGLLLIGLVFAGQVRAYTAEEARSDTARATSEKAFKRREYIRTMIEKSTDAVKSAAANGQYDELFTYELEEFDVEDAVEKYFQRRGFKTRRRPLSGVRSALTISWKED